MHLITSELDPGLLLNSCNTDEWENIVLIGAEVLSQEITWDPRVEARRPSHSIYSDRELIHELHNRANALFENILPPLANSIDNEESIYKWSTRSWQIFLGPWLKTFISATLHKEETLMVLLREYPIGTVTRYQGEEVPSANTRSWLNNLQNGNSHVRLAADVGIGLGLKTANSSFDSKLSTSQLPSTEFDRMPGQLQGFRFPYRKQRVFLNATYLGYFRERAMEVWLGQLPTFPKRDKKLEVTGPSDELRNQVEARLLENLPSEIHQSKLSVKWWAKHLSKYIPVSLLESRNVYRDAAVEFWPSEPNAIFDSNGYWADDVFKAYAAQKTSRGSKLVLGQHGGVFGSVLWSEQESHMINVSDTFLSWGWGSNQENKILPLGRLKPLHPVKPKNFGDITLTLMDYPGYFYGDASMPMGKQDAIQYLEDQILFAENLEPLTRGKLRVRLYAKDRGNLVGDRLSAAGLRRFHLAKEPLFQELKHSSICVATYNSTVYLETLAANFPTLCFWREKNWEVRESARSYLKELVDVGILHYSPESAAKFLNSNFGSISDWWNRYELQEVRVRFVDRYAKSLEFKKLSGHLKTIKNPATEE